jgi:ubiquinone/menaquinone biosynthesis C-methylase UbiE
MSSADDIREAYRRRAARGADDRYALTDPANLYLYQRRERDLLALLRRRHLLPLAGQRILDIGCGSGDVLRDLVRFGATPALLEGIDLLPERIDAARERSAAAINFRAGDATALPCKDASFDVALQFTLLSSVVDGAARRAVCRETLRVLRPGGTVIIYDFTWNPRNRDVRGVGAGELRRLYEGCAVDARRVTLAPPISRRLARLSFTLCRALEALPPLRSHLLAAVRKPA